MKHESINFDQKFNAFSEQWKPKVIAEMNDYQFKVVKLEGDLSGMNTPIPTRHLL